MKERAGEGLTGVISKEDRARLPCNICMINHSEMGWCLYYIYRLR